MNYFLPAMVLLIVVVFLLVVLKKGNTTSKQDSTWPFYAKKLLSQPEQVLYSRLVGALPEHVIFAQVQVSRVLGVKKGFNFNEWNNRINRLSYDFVVCAKDTTVLAAIELDDKSHNSASRAETDNKKDQASLAAGIRVIRWNVHAIPDNYTVRKVVLRL